MTDIALACGEVPWERGIIDAISRSACASVGRRYVDMAALLADARSGALAPAIVLSPALRGFDAKPMSVLLATGIRVVVLLDSIRPPWLDASEADCRELASSHLPSLIEELSEGSDVATRCAGPAPSRTQDITVFIGASGGVGTSSLAWIQHLRQRDAVLIDAAAAPSLAFLRGESADSSSLLSTLASHQRGSGAPLRASRVLTVAAADVDLLGEHEAESLADACARERTPLIVDAGTWPLTALARTLLPMASRCVLVTSAAPMGVLRLGTALTALVGPKPVVVVNRFRETLARGPRARAALCDLVERTFSVRPHLIDDDAAAFDRAWLRGDWQSLEARVPRVD